MNEDIIKLSHRVLAEWQKNNRDMHSEKQALEIALVIQSALNVQHKDYIIYRDLRSTADAFAKPAILEGMAMAVTLGFFETHTYDHDGKQRWYAPRRDGQPHQF
jgi:hypothetical protein